MVRVKKGFTGPSHGYAELQLRSRAADGSQPLAAKTAEVLPEPSGLDRRLTGQKGRSRGLTPRGGVRTEESITKHSRSRPSQPARDDEMQDAEPAESAGSGVRLEPNPNKRQPWWELPRAQWSKTQRKKAARFKAGLKPHSGRKTARGKPNPLTEVQRKQRTLKRLDEKEEKKRIELLKKQPKSKALQEGIESQKKRVRKAFLEEQSKTKEQKTTHEPSQASCSP